MKWITIKLYMEVKFNVMSDRRNMNFFITHEPKLVGLKKKNSVEFVYYLIFTVFCLKNSDPKLGSASELSGIT